jgi:DUF917 family protein
MQTIHKTAPSETHMHNMHTHYHNLYQGLATFPETITEANHKAILKLPGVGKGAVERVCRAVCVFGGGEGCMAQAGRQAGR